MIDTRVKNRMIADGWDDFSLKVFSINTNPEYLLSSVRNISEIGMSGTIELGATINEKDILSGIIESEVARTKIKYTGKVKWTKETPTGIQFGLKFLEELILPDVLIARSMAAV